MRRRGSGILPRQSIAAMALAAVALAAAAAGAARAQSPVAPPSIEVAPATATVGDRIGVTLRVDHAPDVSVSAPGFGADFGGLELVEVAQPVDQVRSSRETRTTFSYSLTSFRTGMITIPPLTVTYSGAASGSVQTEPRTVTIRSVLAPGDTELRPLKPQLDIGGGAPSPVAPALFVAAFAALTAFGYALHRRIAAVQSPVLAAPAAPPPTAAARAREALDAITAAGLAEGDPDEHYARIALTVRRYLSERFGFPAYALTRSEMERAMTGAGVERWPSRLTANLLAQCDAVEFAKFRPAAGRRDADLTAAYEIVALTSGEPGDAVAVAEEGEATPRAGEDSSLRQE